MCARAGGKWDGGNAPTPKCFLCERERDAHILVYRSRNFAFRTTVIICIGWQKMRQRLDIVSAHAVEEFAIGNVSINQSLDSQPLVEVPRSVCVLLTPCCASAIKAI